MIKTKQNKVIKKHCQQKKRSEMDSDVDNENNKDDNKKMQMPQIIATDNIFSGIISAIPLATETSAGWRSSSFCHTKWQIISFFGLQRCVL